MLLKLSIFFILALCKITSAIYPRTKTDESRPNVIIMHVNNMVKLFQFDSCQGMDIDEFFKNYFANILILNFQAI